MSNFTEYPKPKAVEQPKIISRNNTNKQDKSGKSTITNTNENIASNSGNV